MPTFSSKLVTIERHILDEQAQRPGATGELTNLLYDVALAAKIISREVNRAGLADIFGETGDRNVSVGTSAGGSAGRVRWGGG